MWGMPNSDNSISIGEYAEGIKCIKDYGFKR